LTELITPGEHRSLGATFGWFFKWNCGGMLHITLRFFALLAYLTPAAARLNNTEISLRFNADAPFVPQDN